MKLNENDFYLNESGQMVLSAIYLKERGYCCGNGCWNCPYDYENVLEPKRNELRRLRASVKEKEHGKRGNN
jgi:hypothetical protein